MNSRAPQRAAANSLAGLLLAASLFCITANASSSPDDKREVTQPVTTVTTQQSGIWAWLQSLLPIRLTGPALRSKNESRVLATAQCFDSGAGVSCNGFKNVQDYLAAAHASQALGIPFQSLKERMQSGRTLHQAIQELRPGAHGQSEASQAEQQAQKTLRDLSS